MTISYDFICFLMVLVTFLCFLGSVQEHRGAGGRWHRPRGHGRDREGLEEGGGALRSQLHLQGLQGLDHDHIYLNIYMLY